VGYLKTGSLLRFSAIKSMALKRNNKPIYFSTEAQQQTDIF